MGLGVDDDDCACPSRIFAFFDFNLDAEPNNPAGSLSTDEPDPESDYDSDSIREDSTLRLMGRLLGVVGCTLDNLEGGCCLSLPFVDDTLGRSDVDVDPFLYPDPDEVDVEADVEGRDAPD